MQRRGGCCWAEYRATVFQDQYQNVPRRLSSSQLQHWLRHSLPNQQQTISLRRLPVEVPHHPIALGVFLGVTRQIERCSIAAFWFAPPPHHLPLQRSLKKARQPSNSKVSGLFHVRRNVHCNPAHSECATSLDFDEPAVHAPPINLAKFCQTT